MITWRAGRRCSALGACRRLRALAGAVRRGSAAAGRRGAAARRRAATGAGRRRRRRCDRAAPATGPVRLGDTRDRRRCAVTNASVRTLRGRVRDAWVPSAGAAPPYASTPSDSTPGERADADHRLTPTRRGDRPAVAGHGPLATGRSGWRSGRPRRPAGRDPAVDAAGAAPRSRPGGSCRRSWPGCGSSTARSVTRGRGQGTEFDSLREYVIGDDVRSIDWRGQRPPRATWWSAPGGRSATGGCVCVLDTGRTSARPGRRRAPAGRRHRRRAAAGRAGRPRRRPGRPARRRHRVRATVHRRQPSGAAAAGWSTRWRPLQPALVETDFGLVVARGPAPRAQARAWWCSSPRWSRARSARACCRCCPGWPPGTRSSSPRCTTRRSTALATAAPATPPDVYAAAAARAGAGRAGPGRAPRCPVRRCTVVDAPADTFASGGRRHLPRASRPPAGSEPAAISAGRMGCRRAAGSRRAESGQPGGRRSAGCRAQRRPPAGRAATDVRQERQPHRRADADPQRRPAAGDGVTNASSSAADQRTARPGPSATSIADRPASASARPACAAGRGAIHAQPIRSPTPAATKTAVSSSSPCGVISPKKTSARPLAIITPPTRPTFSAFCHSR